jgi:predicted DNA-binding transcriptional regulator YafY
MLRLLAANGQGMTAEELARELGVSVRTINRDLAAVQDDPLRAPIYQDRGYRWRMLEPRPRRDIF